MAGDVLWFPEPDQSRHAALGRGVDLPYASLAGFASPSPVFSLSRARLGGRNPDSGAVRRIFDSDSPGRLLIRRLATERNLYISILGDYFSLFLLLGISVSGFLLGVFFRTYIVDVKALALGLVHFNPVQVEVHWLFACIFSWSWCC
jgi:hypothetical protein